MKLETSFDHAWLLRGHVKRIITESGAGIRCPDLSDFNHLPKRYSIWIRGSLNSVYAASLLLNVTGHYITGGSDYFINT